MTIYRRLKVELFILNKLVNKFWHLLDEPGHYTIGDFINALIEKHAELIAIHGPDFSSPRILIDDYEVPKWESINLLKDNDIIKLEFPDISQSKNEITTTTTKPNKNKRKSLANDLACSSETKTTNGTIKKQKAETRVDTLSSLAYSWDLTSSQSASTSSTSEAICTNYEGCIAGSSMVRLINPNRIFAKRKILFKSISGGKINDLLLYFKGQGASLHGCKIFVLTIGSNDCDSKIEMDVILHDMKALVEYLLDIKDHLAIFLNKLIPREKTRYTLLSEFENRRVKFNDFIQNELQVQLERCVASSSSFIKIVEHPSFEIKSNLAKYLIDGVHMTPSAGITQYINDIKQCIESTKLL